MNGGKIAALLARHVCLEWKDIAVGWQMMIGGTGCTEINASVELPANSQSFVFGKFSEF